METLRSFIYTICITSIIGEIIIYLLPNVRYHSVMRFLIALIILSSIFSTLRVIDFNNISFEKYSLYEENVQNFSVSAEEMIKTEQIEIIKDNIEDELKTKLSLYDIECENIFINVHLENKNISSIECELYLNVKYKQVFEDGKDSILNGFDLKIEVYYLGE